ncbi:methionyl-tRNA formyltransferase [Microbacterium sp. MEC084]|uniref:methionyl-tRNA formyltransferase n=1 Tax=unclassified Microbacterium TaxID=2609290 RepID=UPI0006FF19D4|nr:MULTISPECIES: methionyl-tRNA formyltransferase [unclassified Microbacterium]KQZ10051.1 methionyl-tRNA formyltransferase [Microbacterium sp. Root53]MCD1267315.1 methionyl-tRNA formyltransferase [Microbacterium sp. MEC084]
MRIVFAGTPSVAVPSLHALHAAGHDIAAVVTRPDAPLGRKRVLTPSPVAAAAEELGLPVIKAARLDAEATERIAALDPELAVVVAYGGLVREPLLSLPPHGWINLHFSLLPRWRGAAPVQRALMAGDRVTGAAVFRLVPELDAGDVFDELRYDVPADATAGDVLEALADLGAGLLADVVDGIAAGTAVAVPQKGEATHAAKLSIDDGLLDWREPADRVLDRFRGVTPEPGAHTLLDGARFKILAARPADADAEEPLPPGRARAVKRGVLVGTGTEPILVERVQPAGKAAMDAAAWARGTRADVVFETPEATR